MKSNFIGFNMPYLAGNEFNYIQHAIANRKLSGSGDFTHKCQRFFENKYRFPKCLLTNSCTAALEMVALLLNIGPGDEIIMPSFTFVSTANAFLLRGAKIVFVDSMLKHPNMDVDLIQPLINKNTKAIVAVHYAGVACEMETIINIAKQYNLFVIEDAAQAIDSYYTFSDGTVKPLGGIGHFGTFSFHETKNISCGEGGMLVINDTSFFERSEIIWEKGTNRCSFFRGEVDKYRWVDIGSSFLPSELVAAFLYAQLEKLDNIQKRRKQIWDLYFQLFEKRMNCEFFKLPEIPVYATNNGHIFYLDCLNTNNRTNLIEFLKQENINSIFHYISLHNSPYFKDRHDGRVLSNSDHYSDSLLRLPLYYNLTDLEVERIVKTISDFFTHE